MVSFCSKLGVFSMFDNMYRSGECCTAMGFSGIIFIIIGVLSILVVPDNVLLALGIVCIIFGVLLSSLLCCYSGTDITGHAIPKEFEKAYVKSVEDSRKRIQKAEKIFASHDTVKSNNSQIQLNQVQPVQSSVQYK